MQAFAAGRLTPIEFQVVVNRAIVAGPQLVRYEGAEPDVVFPAALEAAFFLDMVLDEGPMQDLEEARRLAEALAAVLSMATEDDPLVGHLLELARWKDENAERIRAFVRGEVDRSGFERFVSRRTWPAELQHAISGLDDFQLLALADSMVSNDWPTIRRIVAAA